VESTDLEGSTRTHCIEPLDACKGRGVPDSQEDFRGGVGRGPLQWSPSIQDSPRERPGLLAVKSKRGGGGSMPVLLVGFGWTDRRTGSVSNQGNVECLHAEHGEDLSACGIEVEMVDHRRDQKRHCASLLGVQKGQDRSNPEVGGLGQPTSEKTRCEKGLGMGP